MCFIFRTFSTSLFIQVLLAMHANVEDRGIKGDITPLMAAASGGYVDIVKLLLVHGADVNAQSSTGKCLLCCYAIFCPCFLVRF